MAERVDEAMRLMRQINDITAKLSHVTNIKRLNMEVCAAAKEGKKMDN